MFGLVFQRNKKLNQIVDRISKILKNSLLFELSVNEIVKP